MIFIENSTNGRPALALVAIKNKQYNSRIIKIGDIRAIRLIAQLDFSGKNNARKELLKIVKLSKNWRIAEGSALSEKPFKP